MGSYFKPWRRNCGVVTLVLACLLTAGWVRSYVVMDQFCYRTGKSHQHLFSIGGQVWWERLLEQRGTLHCRWHDTNKNTNVIICRPEDIIWRWKLGSCEFGEFPDVNIGKTTHSIIPYWLVVTPLTVVSAWLLLSKLRHQKEKPTGEDLSGGKRKTRVM